MGKCMELYAADVVVTAEMRVFVRAESMEDAEKKFKDTSKWNDSEVQEIHSILDVKDIEEK